MPDYSKAKIYKLESTEDDAIYVGSTCSPLHKRMYEHRCHAYAATHDQARKVYKHMNTIGVEMYQITLVESLSTIANKDELRARERFWITTLAATLNTRVPGRTKSESYAANTEAIKAQRAQYRARNVDAINAYKAQPIQCNCGSTIKRGGKSQHLKSKKHEDWQAGIAEPVNEQPPSQPTQLEQNYVDTSIPASDQEIDRLA